MDDIAALTGASHGTFYTYFRSKDDVLASLVAELGDDPGDDLVTHDGAHILVQYRGRSVVDMRYEWFEIP